MAQTGTTNHLGLQPDTPTPYRVPTSAVILWTPREITTTEHAVIREQITPNRGWWQNLRTWHVATYVISYTVIVGGLFAFAATHGAIR